MILSIICSSFDIIILYIYFKQILGNKNDNINKYIFALSYVFSEVCLLLMIYILSKANSQSSMYINIFTSLMLTFALSFLHDCNIRHKIFATISFQVFATLSEIIVYIVFSMLPDNMKTTLFEEEVYGGISSKIVLFILLNITMLFFEKRKEFRSVKYSMMILIMPLLSILLMLTIPIKKSTNPSEYTLTLIGLSGILIANVVNYFLLQNIIYLNEAKQTKLNLDKQIGYQVEKYCQLSTAYRDTRRLIHDTKKHYFMIRELVDRQEYAKTINYINDSITNLENVYNNINTGNLVIDSFVSNYALIAKQDGIQFRTNLQINPNCITIKDYDLSIIIGNLLDNALNSCRTIPAPYPKQITLEISTSSKELLIHIYNTIVNSYSLSLETEKNNNTSYLYHGFGTQNVERITLSYKGNYSTRVTNDEYHAIVSIPHL